MFFEIHGDVFNLQCSCPWKLKYVFSCRVLSLNLSLIYLHWKILDIWYYVSLRCTHKWLDIYIHYEMLSVLSLVTTWSLLLHTKFLKYFWPYSLWFIPIPKAYILYNWKFVPLSSLLLFNPPPHLSGWQPLNFFSSSTSLFSFSLFCVSDSTYEWVHMVSIFPPLPYFT